MLVGILGEIIFALPRLIRVGMDTASLIGKVKEILSTSVPDTSANVAILQGALDSEMAVLLKLTADLDADPK